MKFQVGDKVKNAVDPNCRGTITKLTNSNTHPYYVWWYVKENLGYHTHCCDSVLILSNRSLASCFYQDFYERVLDRTR